MYEYYYLYKIKNTLNGKIYVGIHRTNDLEDGYMGSGTLLKRAQNKYGFENFEKEILEYFDNERDMYNREIELVDGDFVLREDTYNLTEGGNGGSFAASSKGGKIGGKMTGYNNFLKLAQKQMKEKSGIFSKESREKNRKYLISEDSMNHLLKLCEMMNSSDDIKNKRKETYRNIKHQQGKKNSQYGTMWITNGTESKKIKKDDLIPDGWKKGRKIKHT
jgi:hypothetical protein